MMERCRHKLTMYDFAVFQVSIRGMLDESWSDYFGTQSVSTEIGEDGVAVTTFTTEAVDQAALVGLINRLNSLGLPLLAVEVLPEKEGNLGDGDRTAAPQTSAAAGGV